MSELACDHARRCDGAVDRGRFDDLPVECNSQDIPNILPGEVSETSDSVPFHREIDLRTFRLFLNTDADLPWVHVFPCKLSLAFRNVLSELIGAEGRTRRKNALWRGARGPELQLPG